MNFYQHHLGDYLRDTAHLSMLEDAAYRRLLDAYYVRERPLPADVRECCKLARATSKAERDAVAYVLRQFFDRRESGYHQKRADAEIAAFQDKQHKAKRSAHARWSAQRGLSDGNADASADASSDAMRTHPDRTSEGTADGMPRARVPTSSNQEPKELPPGGRETSPDVAEKPPPALPDPHEKRPMSIDWAPSAGIETLIRQSGLLMPDPQALEAERLEFVAYWLTKPDCRTAHEWDHALVKSLKVAQAKRAAATTAGGPTNAASPRRSTSDPGGTSARRSATLAVLTGRNRDGDADPPIDGHAERVG